MYLIIKLKPQQLLIILAQWLLIFIILSTEVLACDPNEECNRCLLSAFGHCVQRGNDPVCEARKKICQDGGPVAPIIIDTPGSPLRPGGPIPKEAIENCISDPSHCPAEFLSRTGYEVVRPIVQQYLHFLKTQAHGHWQMLDPDFINDWQSDYSVDLRQVRYATSINTVHGQAITIGYNIFFPNEIDISYQDDEKLMLHELEHVVQYSRRGGVEPFLSEYILKSAGKIIARRSINIHDFVDIESAAIRKSSLLWIKKYGLEFVITNKCKYPIRVALNARDIDGNWNTYGFFNLSVGQSVILAEENGEPIRSNNGIFYIYAETGDGRYKWIGDREFTIESKQKTEKFMRIKLNLAGMESITRSFSCDNI